MERTYTEKERLQIYKQALIEIESQSVPIYGLCHSIALSLNKIYTTDLFDLDNIDLNWFPEIISKKPKKLYRSWRWFDCSDCQSRIDILKQSIEELNKEKL